MCPSVAPCPNEPNDIFAVLLSVSGGPNQAAPGDRCAANTNSSSPMGISSGTGANTMTYDLSSFAGQSLGLSLDWTADALNNNGLGVVIDNVSIRCTRP